MKLYELRKGTEYQGPEMDKDLQYYDPEMEKDLQYQGSVESKNSSRIRNRRQR